MLLNFLRALLPCVAIIVVVYFFIIQLIFAYINTWEQFRWFFRTKNYSYFTFDQFLKCKMVHLKWIRQFTQVISCTRMYHVHFVQNDIVLFKWINSVFLFTHIPTFSPILQRCISFFFVPHLFCHHPLFTKGLLKRQRTFLSISNSLFILSYRRKQFLIFFFFVFLHIFLSYQYIV